jgi:hypothetical protein
MSNLIPNGFIDVNGGLATLTFKRRLAHPIEEVCVQEIKNRSQNPGVRSLVNTLPDPITTRKELHPSKSASQPVAPLPGKRLIRTGKLSIGTWAIIRCR